VPLTLIRMAVKNDVAVQMGVIYDSPDDQNETGRLDVCCGCSQKLRSFTEKELETTKTA
jgi:hypothetical protein